MDYRVWALLSALFAGITAILAKKGVDGVPANTALLIRVVFVVGFSAILALSTGQAATKGLTRENWIYLFFSALATFLSWLCYFRALQAGEVAKVAPIDKLSFVIAAVLGVIILKEKIDLKTMGGIALIVAGVIVTLL